MYQTADQALTLDKNFTHAITAVDIQESILLFPQGGGGTQLLIGLGRPVQSAKRGSKN